MSTYDYLNYRELKKLNKTVEKIEQREEQFARLHVKNKTELNYILDSAWEHCLSESSIKIYPKTVKFRDENNSQYEFLLILDISGFFDKTNLEIRGFNSFTQQWIIDYYYSQDEIDGEDMAEKVLTKAVLNEMRQDNAL